MPGSLLLLRFPYFQQSTGGGVKAGIGRLLLVGKQRRIQSEHHSELCHLIFLLKRFFPFKEREISAAPGTQ